MDFESQGQRKVAVTNSYNRTATHVNMKPLYVKNLMLKLSNAYVTNNYMRLTAIGGSGRRYIYISQNGKLGLIKETESCRPDVWGRHQTPVRDGRGDVGPELSAAYFWCKSNGFFRNFQGFRQLSNLEGKSCGMISAVIFVFGFCLRTRNALNINYLY